MAVVEGKGMKGRVEGKRRKGKVEGQRRKSRVEGNGMKGRVEGKRRKDIVDAQPFYIRPADFPQLTWGGHSFDATYQCLHEPLI